MAEAKISGQIRTAEEVKDLFRIIGLAQIPETDAEIRKIGAAKWRPMKQIADHPEKQTDVARLRKAEKWLDAYGVLSNWFQDALNLIQAGAFESADRWCSIWVSDHPNEMSGGARDALERKLEAEWTLAPALTRNFVDRWMADRGVRPHGVLVEPAMVANLRATWKSGGVVVEWDKPTLGFDKARLLRKELRSGRVETLLEENASSWIDRKALLPGSVYRYQIHTVLGRKATQQAVESNDVFVPGQVKIKSKPRWTGSAIHVDWEPAPGSVSTHVFRGADAEPTEGVNPIAGNLGPPLLDRDVKKGVTYKYLFVPQYQEATVKGVVTDPVRIPKPPPPPKRVDAVYDTASNVVTVSWVKSAEHLAGDQFLVRRLPGKTRAARPQDGEEVGEWTSDTTVIDENVSVGRECSYAVFVKRGNLISPAPTHSRPVLALREVWNVLPVPRDGEIALSWEVDPAVHGIEIRRTSPPPSPDARIELNGLTAAGERGLQNGQVHVYRIRCGYQDPSRGEVFSNGKDVKVTPFTKPIAVGNFDFELHGESLWLRCPRPASGELEALRCPSALPYKPGTVVPLEELSKLGTRLRPRSQRPDVIEDQNPKPSESLYTVLTVSRPMVAVGPTRQFAGSVKWRLERAHPLCNRLKRLFLRSKRKGSRAVLIEVEGNQQAVGRLCLVGGLARNPEKIRDGKVLAEWQAKPGEKARMPLRLPLLRWDDANGEVWCELFAESVFRVRIEGPTDLEDLLL